MRASSDARPVERRRVEGDRAWPHSAPEHEMDGSQFDRIAKELAAPQTRRRALRGLLLMAGGALAGAAGLKAEFDGASSADAATCQHAGDVCGARRGCCQGLTCCN